MKLKRTLALLLALVLMASLVTACGSSDSSSDADEEAAAVSEETVEEAAEEESEAAPASDTVFEPMEITVSTSTAENENPSKALMAMMDYITDATGGAVTFNVYWGSTYCDSTEELYQLQSGALDMVILLTMAYGDVLPQFVCVPGIYPGSDEDSKDYFNAMYAEGETGDIIGESFANYNAHMLGTIYTGYNCFFSTKELVSISDLEGKKVGCQDSAPLDNIGLTAVFVDVGDYYDSLDRGVIDGGTFSFDGTYNLKLYEAAPNVLLEGDHKTWGMPFCVRDDLWDTFSDELKQIFMDGMAIAQDTSVELVNESNDAAVDELRDSGIEVNEMTQEDLDYVYEGQLTASIASGMNRAEAADCVDDVVLILTDALEYLGYDPDEYLSDYIN